MRQTDMRGGDTLLTPRNDIQCPEQQSLKSIWSGIYLIENSAARAFWQDIRNREEEGRLILRDSVEDLIRGFASYRYRSWMSDFDFMAKFLRLEQLEIYAPYFVKLCHIMPVDLKRSRQRIVGRYIFNRLSNASSYAQRQVRKFVRSSVILYPAKDLFPLASSFVGLIERHQDQSKGAVRKQVALMARSVLMMSDGELALHYQSYGNYTEHLAFLRGQCRYFQLSDADILQPFQA